MMSRAAWRRVREHFEALVDLAPSDRRTSIAELAELDPVEKQELLDLLAADESAEGLLDARAEDAEARLPFGGRIAGYELLRVLGAGRMGTVFEAVEERSRRTVALEVLRLRLDSPAALRRFCFEVEALGRLRHPGIAQVYETGVHTTELGELPFIAMELVPGARSLLAHARAEGLDVPSKLRLFLDVLDAVHHGHQKGVIHGDVEDGNLLVDVEGRVKVTDFGVARAALSGGSTWTSSNELVASLGKISPEQLVDSREVDVRSDVYSLGAVLYELLSARPPYALGVRSRTEALSILGGPAPPRLGALDARLSGDLEWIVAKAMERDPERRFAGAHELANDLRRHSAHEPVEAAPASVRYRLGKLVRRNRASFAAAIAVVAVLAVGLVRAELARRDEARARSTAERETRNAREVNAFLAGIVTSDSPSRRGRDALVVDALDEAALEIEAELAGDPEVQAAIRKAVGDAYLALGLHEEAEGHLSAAMTFVERSVDPEDPFAIGVRASWIAYLHRSEQHAAAVALGSRLLELAERRLGSDHDHSIRIRRVLADSLRALDARGE